jgi:ParB-like chromosome segregation protein Spo0J
MKREILNAPINNFQVHPEVVKTYRDRELDSLMYTLNKFGQQNPILVVERKGQLYIWDGVSRFKAAKQLGLPSILYKK